MTYIEQSIKEAGDQGYQPNVERYPEMEGISPLQIAMAMQADVFIDPAFWKALGKKRGWTTDNDFKYWQKSVVEWEEKYWKKFWHRFIDHLAEGKDAESFFQEKRGWTTDNDFKYWQKSVVEWEEKYWKKFWHRFIDHLAEGKDAESFFQSL